METNGSHKIREILFKGKRLDNGQWIEGYYMRHENRMPAPIGDTLKEGDVDHLILFDEFADWNMPRGIKYAHVYPSTVCQYTGLTDKNDKKIFEGDIIKGKSEQLYTVEYSDRIAGFVTRGTGVLSTPCMNTGTMLYYEIIGNIHDGKGGQFEPPKEKEPTP